MPFAHLMSLQSLPRDPISPLARISPLGKLYDAFYIFIKSGNQTQTVSFQKSLINCPSSFGLMHIYGKAMTGSDRKVVVSKTQGRHGEEKNMEEPEWANGLKQLYDSVVDEPLPDAFRDLLAKLDGNAGGESSAPK